MPNMPMRGFFRGSGGDKKKERQQKSSVQQQRQSSLLLDASHSSTKKRSQQQQYQQSHPHQQKQQQTNISPQRPSSGSKTSNNKKLPEPPLHLSGPPQPIPPRLGHGYDSCINDVHLQACYKSSQEIFSLAAPRSSDAEEHISCGRQIHYHPSLDQSRAPTQKSYQQHPQHHDVTLQYHQQQLSHSSQSYANQSHHHSYEALQVPNQRQQYTHKTTVLQHQSSQFHQLPVPGAHLTRNITPSVDDASDEIWRCDGDDFRSASHAIQMLRLAIVAEWERQQQNPEVEHSHGGRLGINRDRRGRTHDDESATNSLFSYDPSETFLCLQGAALRFHARFQSIQNRRDAEHTPRKQLPSEGKGAEDKADTILQDQQQNSIRNSIDLSRNHLTTGTQETDALEWELTEQAAWEVWEESVRASAALAHACVGPAWREQLKQRRQWLREVELGLPQRYRTQNYGRLRDSGSEGSSIGGFSLSSNISLDVSNPQSSGRLMTRQQTNTMDQMAQNNRGTAFLSGARIIPEVLPAAMLRFAASASETSVPPIRHSRTKIAWNTEKSSAKGKGALLESLGLHLRDERRWLRRRKRLGDTQRDLAFSMFCAGVENENRADAEAHRTGDTGFNGDGNKWSIPGAHVPVSSMIHSWLETCQAGWPIPKVGEDDSIPQYVEDILTDQPAMSESMQLAGGGDKNGCKRSNDEECLALPREIVLPLQLDPTPHSNNAFIDESSKVRNKSNSSPERVIYSLWGDIVDVSTTDWWYTLRVLRDCSDLVSVGWRPPPSGQIGEEIILNLISIAEKGLGHLSGDTNNLPEIPKDRIQKERLVACSCASESLAALKNLASRDVLPHATVGPLVSVLCGLLSAAEATISARSNIGPEEEQAEDALLEKEIAIQRTFVASNSAELLWVLLSNESTSCPTTDALLDSIDVDLSTQDPDAQDKCSGKHFFAASGAIRALSAALWGDPPQVKGVPLLRFFWQTVIDLFGGVASTLHSEGVCNHSNTEVFLSNYKTSVLRMNCRFWRKNSFLVVVLEIALALRRLIDSELVYGTGDLCPTEWESLIGALDLGLSPWLLYPEILNQLSDCKEDNDDRYLQHEIYSEVKGIFSQIQAFLMKCSQVECRPFHLIVDDDCRFYLHIFLLRKACPAMAPCDARKLALTVIRSWCVTGYLPFREGDWCERGIDIIAEAFALYDAPSSSRYPWCHVHSPTVRLEALKSLVDDYHESNATPCSRGLDSESISTVTSVSVHSDTLPMFSLFSLTRNVRDLHLELISSLLLPLLVKILVPTSQDRVSDISFIPTVFILMPQFVTEEGRSLEQHNCESNKVPSLIESLDVIGEEFLLFRFAVRVVGTLFRSVTGEREQRSRFIDLLKQVAVAEPQGLNTWVNAMEANGQQKSLVVEKIALESFRLHLESIRQLELCLSSPFGDLPHTHGLVPAILETLCDAASFYSDEGIASHQTLKSNSFRNNRVMLTLACILPLARLSCARNGQGIFKSRGVVARSVPATVLSAISVDEWIYRNNQSTDQSETLPILPEQQDPHPDDDSIAPFVFVRQCRPSEAEDSRSSQRSRRRQNAGNGKEHQKEGTLIEMEPIFSALKFVLRRMYLLYTQIEGKKTSIDMEPARLSDLCSIVRIVCYDAISSFLSHGMLIPFLNGDELWLNLDFLLSGTDNEADIVSRSRVLSAFAGIVGHAYLSCVANEETILSSGQKVCCALVKLTMSDHPEVLKNSCWGLLSILSSLRNGWRRKLTNKGSSEIHNSLVSGCFVPLIDHIYSLSVGGVSCDGVLLMPLITAMRDVILCAVSLDTFSKSLRRRAFLACLQLGSHNSAWHIQVIIFHCANAIIESMTRKEARLMLFLVTSTGLMGCNIDHKLDPRKAYNFNQQRIRPLFVDLLRRKLINVCQMVESDLSPQSRCNFAQIHKKLARETLSFEKFPVDMDDNGRLKSATWKYGNILLTLQVGSETSIYRGWMEIVIRSSSFRLRRLINWKEENVAENPDSFLPFWEQLHRFPEGGNKQNEILESMPSRWQSSDLEKSLTHPEISSSSNMLAEAKNLVEHFDSWIGIPTHRDVCIGPNDVVIKQEISLNNFTLAYAESSTPFRDVYRRRYKHDHVVNNVRREPGLFHRKAIKRNMSEGDIECCFHRHNNRTDEGQGNADCVHSWLQIAIKSNSGGMRHIQEELETLGFSSSSLGFLSTASHIATSSSYPAINLNHSLMPFENSPNYFRAVSILDRTTPFQTHKVALLYGGSSSTKKNSQHKKSNSARSEGNQILTATQGSTNFWKFAKELGDFVPVRHLKYFSGGLDTSTSSADGSFAIVWFGDCVVSENIVSPTALNSMIIFHTVPLMPDGINMRKRHVGNDIVYVVYGLETLDINHENLAISGHFGFVTIYVVAFTDIDVDRISLYLKEGLDKDFCAALNHLVGSFVVSRHVSAVLVRDLAVNADLICRSLMEDKLGRSLNLEERFVRINNMNRHLRQNVPAETNQVEEKC